MSEPADVNEMDWGVLLVRTRMALTLIQAHWMATKYQESEVDHLGWVEEVYLPLLSELRRFCVKVENRLGSQAVQGVGGPGGGGG